MGSLSPSPVAKGHDLGSSSQNQFDSNMTEYPGPFTLTRGKARQIHKTIHLSSIYGSKMDHLDSRNRACFIQSYSSTCSLFAI